MGYPHLQKGYKLLRLDNYSILISRHVKFHETIFPLHSKSNSITKTLSTTTGNAYSFLEWLHSYTSSSPEVSNSDNLGDFSSLVSPSINNIPSHVTSIHNPPVINDNVVDTSTSSFTSIPDSSVPTRHSQRTSSRPSWWKDYHIVGPKSSINSLTSYVSDHIGTKSDMLLSHQSFDHNDQAFVAFSDSKLEIEPSHYYQAVYDPRWVKAMDNELQALESNNTWTLVPLPAGKKVVGCKWVYKIKYLANGTVDRFKTRLVAKGYTQSAGIDYHDTFAPVVKMVTVRCLFAIAATNNWPLEQLDINNAFLHGNLSEEVYMELPLGYQRQSSVVPLVCRLIKSIYGLKQASREWFTKLTTSLLSIGYTHSLLDYSLFILKTDSTFLAVVVYVDDILITGNDMTEIQGLKYHLDKEFSIKNLGSIKYYLGL